MPDGPVLPIFTGQAPVPEVESKWISQTDSSQAPSCSSLHFGWVWPLMDILSVSWGGTRISVMQTVNLSGDSHTKQTSMCPGGLAYPLGGGTDLQLAYGSPWN